MNLKTTFNGIRLDTPATYRIRVQGHLDASWSDQLGGMVISRAYTDKKNPVTEPTFKRMAETKGVHWSWQPYGSYTLFAGGFQQI